MSIVGRVLIVVTAFAAVVLVGPAQLASASCVENVPPSPNAFTGTVLATESGGRIAQVRTDDGRNVEVRGTPSPDAITSVDRTYVVGTRYEFHPINATDPFEDNICTKTRALAPAATAPSSTTPTSSGGTAWLVAGGALALVAAGAGLLWTRLHR